MKTNSTFVVLIRIVAFILLCLYSLLVFGQAENVATKHTGKLDNLGEFHGMFVNDKKICLHWTLIDGNTASSVTIEKGNSMDEFRPQAEFWVNMEGNSRTEFRWPDTRIAKGSVFYRLKIVDNKGSTSYSNVIQLTSKKGNSAFYEYPLLNRKIETAAL